MIGTLGKIVPNNASAFLAEKLSNSTIITFDIVAHSLMTEADTQVLNNILELFLQK
jgi:pimeloyl-ACP methyl ester carboxylesterase